MRCAITLACIALCGCGNRHRSSGPISQDAYIWQRIWSEPVLAAATNAKGKIRELVPLAAEVEFTGSGLQKVLPKLPLDKLVNYPPIGLALRVGALPRRVSAASPEIQQLAAIAQDLVVQAKTAGLQLSELQLDFDCPASKLSMYRQILAEIQRSVAPLPVHITVLPSWMSSAEFGPLIKQAGEFVLQVHAVSVPRAGVPPVLCDPIKARRWVEEAARFGVPFRVALPTYSSALVFDEKGRISQVISEGQPPASSSGIRVEQAQANASELAELVRNWMADRPQSLEGIIWYRLPVSIDSMNWRWATLSAVMEGRQPRASLRVEISDTIPADVYLVNDGELDLSAPSQVRLDWSGADLVSADGLGGFQLETGKYHVILHLTSSTPPVLQPGERMAIGWLRLTSPVSIHAKENP